MIKTFYEQNGGIDATVTFSSDPRALFTFGFSGTDSLLSFSGKSGILYNSGGRILGACGSLERKLEVYAKNGYTSLFLNGKLIDSVDTSSSAYSGFYAESINPYTSDLNVFGDPPSISGGTAVLGPDGLGTGEFTLGGTSPLIINDASVDPSMNLTVVSWDSPAQVGVNQYVFSGDGNYSNRGFPLILETDAGKYDIDCVIDEPFDPTAGSIEMWIDDHLATKSKTINFFVRNSYQTAQSVSFDLSLSSQPEGATLEVDASGLCRAFASFSYTGASTTGAVFTGNVTGRGGRLNDSTVSAISKYLSYEYIPTGYEERRISVRSSGYIDGKLYFGMLYVSGSGRASGGLFHYDIVNETGVPSWANPAGGGNPISPLPSETFTGSTSVSYPVTGKFYGYLQALVSSKVTVYEGDATFTNNWNVKYNSNNFVNQKWTGANAFYTGIGTGSPAFAIPALSKVSGTITFDTDFESTQFYGADFKVGATSLTISNYV